jgi:SAM-dependent methyltransferase
VSVTIDPKAFWEDKILTWELGRYQPRVANNSLLERIADWSSRSLRYRCEISVALIGDNLKHKSILDIGCGSGLLAQEFIDRGATSYLGIDFAESAIRAAEARRQQTRSRDRIAFKVASVRSMPIEQDIVFSLGLLDWLSNEELAILFEKQGRADFLHAIAERRTSIQQLIHRAYVHLSYGHRTQGYKPRYFSAAEIARLAARHRSGPTYAFRDPRLSFGALISTFPIGDPIDL